MQNLQEFLNNCRILYSIDYYELAFCLSKDEYKRFRDNPIKFLIVAEDATATSIWEIVKDRQPKKKK